MSGSSVRVPVPVMEAAWLYFTAGLLIIFFMGQVEGPLFCPSQRKEVPAHLGGTALLPCPFTPPSPLPEAGGKLSWQKTDGDDELVVHFQNGQDKDDRQSEDFLGRTKARRDWMKSGDAGLELERVTAGDAGDYRCFVTLLPLETGSQHRCCEVTLSVMAERGAGESVKGTGEGDPPAPPGAEEDTGTHTDLPDNNNIYIRWIFIIFIGICYLAVPPLLFSLWHM